MPNIELIKVFGGVVKQIYDGVHSNSEDAGQPVLPGCEALGLHWGKLIVVESALPREDPESNQTPSHKPCVINTTL